MPRSAGSGGVASRNPFSFPSRGHKEPPPKNAGSATQATAKYSDHEATGPLISVGEEQTARDATTTDVDPVTVPSSSDLAETIDSVNRTCRQQCYETRLGCGSVVGRPTCFHQCYPNTQEERHQALLATVTPEHVFMHARATPPMAFGASRLGANPSTMPDMRGWQPGRTASQF